MNIFVIVALVAASLLGTVLMIMALRRGAQKKLDYKAFADAQGWHYTPQDGENAHEFRDPGEDWTLRVVFIPSGAAGSTTSRYVEWISPAGALSEGEAALGAPLPDKSVRMMQNGGAMGQAILKAALKGTYYALGRTKFTLDIDEATIADPGGVVMSTLGQEKAMDSLRRNADLAAFRSSHKDVEVPVAIRNSNGLILRRTGTVNRMEDLTELVRLGLSLRHGLLS
ncbi:MAG: hypothetical protein AAGL89_07160 [Pseudomonadota bacterium]